MGSDSSDIETAANEAISELIPEKSRALYEKKFNHFNQWMQTKNKTEITETLMLAYFNSELKSVAPSTKRSVYSILKATIKAKKNIDIVNFPQLTAFLKLKSKGFVPKKSSIFQKADIFRFLREANDFNFLSLKTILIIGISGACRQHEWLNLQVDDVKDLGKCLNVTVYSSKTNSKRQFVISPGNDINFVDIVKKYMALRPPNCFHNRFFIQHIKGKCTPQPIGINRMSACPASIAEFLGLPNPRGYTGHCFRRSSYTLLADTGADVLALKRHGGSKSSTVAEGYVADSIANKRNVASKILNEFGNDPEASTSARA